MGKKILIELSDDLEINHFKNLIMAFLSNENLIGKFRINDFNDVVYIVDYMNEACAVFTRRELAEKYIEDKYNEIGYCIAPCKLNDEDGMYKE